jgi:mono/diheme cytochrome c family protein
MKKTVWMVVIALLVSSMLLTACGGGGGGGSTIQRQSPPADIAGKTNPVAGNADAVSAGQALYTTNCATCHGDQGKGDGPAGASLDPKPANLQATSKETEPQYQYWVIAKGGATAGLSASMPAFEGVLSEADIWNIVTYLDTTYGK